jgi:phosphoribosylaminoimidazole-succinocarboxamide synthase
MRIDMSNALHTSALNSLPLLARGKVRDNYAVGDDRILMVASDRISAFDVIMGEAIPGKGELLTQIASLTPGKAAKLEVMRRNQTLTLDVTPAQRPKPKLQK